MKKLIVPAPLLASARICQAKADPRYYLEGVYIDSERIIGTNGHVMFVANWAEWRNKFNHDISDLYDLKDGVIVNVSGSIPARTQLAELTFIDADIGVSRYMKVRKDINVHQNTDRLGAFKKITGKYPVAAVDRIMNEVIQADLVPTDKIAFNQSYISLAGKVFSLVCPGYKSGQFNFYGPNKSMLVEAGPSEYGDCKMVIMPMRF